MFISFKTKVYDVGSDMWRVEYDFQRARRHYRGSTGVHFFIILGENRPYMFSEGVWFLIV